MKNNENHAICSACGGTCCKHYAGCVYPDQFPNITKELLTDLILDGYCFDCWKGNPTDAPEYENKTAYFLRPKHKDRPYDIMDRSWGGECSFLINDRCKLPFDKRPLMCQALKPKEGKECKCPDDIGKRTAAIAWLPYNELIEEIKNQKR